MSVGCGDHSGCLRHVRNLNYRRGCGHAMSLRRRRQTVVVGGARCVCRRGLADCTPWYVHWTLLSLLMARLIEYCGLFGDKLVKLRLVSLPNGRALSRTQVSHFLRLLLTRKKVVALNVRDEIGLCGVHVFAQLTWISLTLDRVHLVSLVRGSLARCNKVLTIELCEAWRMSVFFVSVHLRESIRSQVLTDVLISFVLRNPDEPIGAVFWHVCPGMFIVV